MPLSMMTAAAVRPPDRLQVTRNNFPYSVAFLPTRPLHDVSAMQPIQDGSRRYFGNIDQLLERERARLKLEFQEQGYPAGTGTPGTGPMAPGIIQNNSSSQNVVLNGGFSGGCKP